MTFREFIIQKIGIDKAIFYTLLGKGLQISTSVFTVLFIVMFLSPIDQGYYYTFGSIVAIQVFFELGLTGIVTQFVAHEVSHIALNVNGKLEGDTFYRSRLASLLKICIKWYSIIAVGLLIVLFIVGFIFFTYFGETQNGNIWQFPWTVLAIGTTMNFLVTPVIAFIEGLGKVKEVAKWRMIQQCIQPIVLWGGLWLGCNIYVLGIDAITKVLVLGILIVNSPIFKVLKNLYHEEINEVVSYKKEIFPYQWRIAVSWISGYFIFQLFNPVLFAAEGAAVAGQMGMTMQAFNALQALTLAWINTKTPRISGLIALKKYEELDSLFNKTKKQLLLIGTSVLLLFLVCLTSIQIYNKPILGMEIGSRFLPTLPLWLMGWSTFTMFPINCWAIYLRSHKKEPLMINSVVMGILCCISTVTMGNLYGLYGIVISFAVLRLVSLIWIYSVYNKKKKEWHISLN